MTENRPEPDPRSEFEDEGIPDLQDGTPGQQRASDPQQAPLPGERPAAAGEFGTTEQEQLEGEPLDARLRRERPDPATTGDPDAARHARMTAGPRPAPTRLVEDDAGAAEDTEKDAVAYEAGPDAGGYSAEEDAVHVDDESEI